jgi:hypothetical protein
MEYLAVCACGAAHSAAKPKTMKCRCGNHLPAEYLLPKDETPFVIITGFRGEKIKVYQQNG